MAKYEIKPGSIGEELTRLISARSETGMIAPLLTSAAISFAHFVLMLVAFCPGFEDPPEFAEINGVLNGSDILKHVLLMRSLSEFIPVWLDSPLEDVIDNFTAEKITDAYNKFVLSQQKAE